MKKIALMTLSLAIVSSCGAKSSAGANNGVYSRVQDALHAQKAGQVTESSVSGTQHEISYDDATNLFSVAKAPLKYKSREIVLKVDGDHIYKYSEYWSNNSTGREVQMESIALETKRMDEQLNKIDFKNDGDYLVGTLKMNGFGSVEEYVSGEVRAEISAGSNVISIRMHSSNLFCDISTTSITSGQTFKSPNLTTKLDTVSDSSTGTCPESLSTTELKKIDLTKIEFCDETKESGEECQEDKDMSFITKEL